MSVPQIPSLFNNNGDAPKQPQQSVEKVDKAPKEISKIEPNEISKKISEALAKATVNWPLMKEKAVACQAALSLVKPITSDEEDQALEKLLVKSKKTYDLISGMRKETTGEFDLVKSMMMGPEKSISTLVGDQESPYHIGVKYRNDWANAKLKKKREEEAEAKRVENETLELSRLKGEFELIFHNNVIDYATTMETNIANYFNKLVLVDEDGSPKWDEMIKRFSLKPALKVETFESWFNLPFDITKLTQDAYDEFVDKVKEVYTYEVINNIYVGLAQPKVDEWKAKLPGKKKELEDLAELAKTNAKEAEKLRKKQEKEAQKVTDKIVATAQENKDSKAAEVKTSQRNETLGAQFETLKVTQNQEDIGAKIKRVPIVNCDPKDIVTVFAQALYHCFVHPDFEGYLKKDKSTGQPLPLDNNGVPEYTSWAKTILNFVAEKTTEQVPGIEFKEIASTSQRSKKD